MPKHRSKRHLTWLSALLLTAACSDSGGGTGGGTNNSGPTTIGDGVVDEGGATVEMADARVDIPPGVLPESLELTIRILDPPPPPPMGRIYGSPVYSFEPSDTTFADPITIRLPVDDGVGDTRAVHYLTDIADEEWERYPLSPQEEGIQVGWVAKNAVFQTRTFGIFAVTHEGCVGETNACGGCEPLDRNEGDPCGDCGQLVCRNGGLQCNDPRHECSVGSQRCAESYIQECGRDDASGCNRWNFIQNCGELGMFCEGDPPMCVATCNSNCTILNMDECYENDAWECREVEEGCLQWVLTNTCEDGDVCVLEGETAVCQPPCVDECSDGFTECSPDNMLVRTCDTTGCPEYDTGVPCPAEMVCVEQGVQPGLASCQCAVDCIPGEMQCNLTDNTVEECIAGAPCPTLQIVDTCNDGQRTCNPDLVPPACEGG